MLGGVTPSCDLAADKYDHGMARWADRLRKLDNRVIGPVRATNTESDWYSGNWIYLVERRALAITLLLFFGAIGAAMGLLALLGVPQNRFTALAVALVVGPLIWRRYTRHHYREQSHPNSE
jgi:hypothetical protein